ncbi:hypothetical protein RB195_008191 [Necator americanus]|uniref:Uncharacterized protein n=1 Tax=Necator americanus TaxID=51031 RepID=A0ABR1CNV7_NECAM
MSMKILYEHFTLYDSLEVDFTITIFTSVLRKARMDKRKSEDDRRTQLTSDKRKDFENWTSTSPYPPRL